VWLNHRSRRTKQFGCEENLPECSKRVLEKKLFFKRGLHSNFPVKTFIKRATNLERFVAVK